MTVFKNSILIPAFLAMNSLFISADFAHADEGGACHFHGKKAATEQTVTECAIKRKENLISSGKIEALWKEIPVEEISQVDGKKAKEWRVTFKDPAAKDKSKEVLYMFFTLPGNFIAANFTGK